jgi:hypothetical protein
MARKVLDVFLSSTAEDLAEHRKAVRDKLTSTGFFCIWQEDFGPQNAGAVEFCRRKAREADIFVGLIGLRRGWEPKGDSKKRSITEMEYDSASEAGRPCYLWVMPDDFPVPGNMRESDEFHARQMAFRKRVMGGGGLVVAERGFNSPDLLAAEIRGHLVAQMLTGELRPEGASPGDSIAAALARLAEDKDVDLLALATNPQGLDVVELVAKLLAREKELMEQATRIAAKIKEYQRHIGALVSLTYTNAASKDVTALAPRAFQPGDKIWVAHRPGRAAVVTKPEFWQRSGDIPVISIGYA